MAGTGQLLRRGVWMREIQHVGGLREVDGSEFKVMVGSRNLYRRTRNLNSGVVLVEAGVQVAHLQDVGLDGGKLETQQACRGIAVFYFRHKPRTGSAGSPAVLEAVAILHR